MSWLAERFRPASILLWLFFGLTIVFLTFPLIVVVPKSFSPSAVIYFPPKGFSTQWYREFFTDPFWLDSLWLSIELGLAVAVLSTILALAAAVSLSRFLRIGRAPMRVLMLSPLIVPVIVTAIGFFDLMSRLDLVGHFLGLLICHTILALPFPFVVLENALRSVDSSLEDAAVSLGSSRFSAFMKITLPLLSASIFGAALFAFLASWDEVVVVLFVGGASLQTLPVKMFEFLTTQVRPTVGAASTVLIAGLLIGVAIVSLASRMRRLRLRARQRRLA